MIQHIDAMRSNKAIIYYPCPLGVFLGVYMEVARITSCMLVKAMLVYYSAQEQLPNGIEIVRGKGQ